MVSRAGGSIPIWIQQAVIEVCRVSCRSRQQQQLARKRREYLDMVPEFYDIENSQRTEDEIGALRQVGSQSLWATTGYGVPCGCLGKAASGLQDATITESAMDMGGAELAEEPGPRSFV